MSNQNRIFSASAIFLSTSIAIYALFFSFFLFELFWISYVPSFSVCFSIFSRKALTVTLSILLLIIIDLYYSYRYLHALDRLNLPVPIDRSFWKYFIANIPWLIFTGFSLVFSLNAFSGTKISFYQLPYFWFGVAILCGIFSGITYPPLWEKEIESFPKEKKEAMMSAGHIVLRLKKVFNGTLGSLLIIGVIFKWTEWSLLSLLLFYLVNRFWWDGTISEEMRKLFNPVQTGSVNKETGE